MQGEKTEFSMKLSKSLQGLLVGSALLLATDAFAQHRGRLHVSSAEMVAGEKLTAGDYTVRWEGTGPEVQCRIMQRARVLVVAPARIVFLDHAAPSDSVVIQIYGNGVRRVSQISFSGQRLALQVEENVGSSIAQGK
jgi:hypothetical protein